MRKIFEQASGFSIIELLVVIAIIAVLLGLSLVSMEGSRKSARDSKRRAELEQIRSALEMYRSDNDVYPNDLTDLSGYIEVPSDPLPSRLYDYQMLSSSTYILCAALETESGVEGSCGSCGSANCNYLVRNP